MQFMYMKERNERLGEKIRSLRQSLNEGQDVFGARLHVEQATVSRWENGFVPKRTLWANIARIARRPVSEFFDIDGDQELGTVPVVGYVGAGAEAILFSEGQIDPEDRVKAPEGSSENTVAVEVRGESLGALFDQWLVFYDDVRSVPSPGLLGKLCVCWLADGRVLVKKLQRGQIASRWTLISNFEPPIYDVAIERAARVLSMAPR